MTRGKGWISLAFAAVVWTAAFSMTAFAAGGAENGQTAEGSLVEDDGGLYYVDENGDRVTSRWVALPNDGRWDEEIETIYYYFDSTGKACRNMRKNIEGKTYFFDSEGRMLSGWQDREVNGRMGSYYLGEEDEGWVHTGWNKVIPEEDFRSVGGAPEWFYFNPNSGQVCRDQRKTIDGKIYFFDEEGCMLSGWHSREDDGEKELYYLGGEDEGWAYTGWHKLVPEEEDGVVGGEPKWFYFHPNNGKAFRGKRLINGNYYFFDEETAAMADHWVRGTPGASDRTGTESNAWYDPETGRLMTGWVYAYDPSDTEEAGDQYWFYLDKDGVAFNEGGRDVHYGEPVDPDNPDSLYTYMGRGLGGEDGITFFYNLAAKVIDGKTYLFDENGHMVKGFYYLWVVKKEGSSRPLGYREMVGVEYGYGGAYYFNEETGSPKEGQMMTGRLKLERSGDYYHYKKSGKAYERAIVNGYLYMEGGALEIPKYGEKYKIVQIDAGDLVDYPLPPVIDIGSKRKYMDCKMIVDTSGRVKKNGTVTFDGYRYTVKDYIVVGAPVPVN